MNHFFRRTVSFLMAMTISLSAVPVPALAAEVPEESIVEMDVVPTETTGAIEIPEETAAETGAAETVQQESTEQVDVPPAYAEYTFDANALVQLEVLTLPDKTSYLTGMDVDLSGLQLTARDSNGMTQTVAMEDGILLESGDAARSGIRTITVTYGNMSVSFPILVHDGEYGEVLQEKSGYPESAHTYPNGSDETYLYTCEDAQYLTLTFSGDTKVEANFDFLYLYDGNDMQIGKYTGTELAGKTVQIDGDTVKIRLTSDKSNNYFGFSLTGIRACVPIPVHEPAGNGVYTAPGCFTDGFTSDTCLICEETFSIQDEGTAAHTYTDGYCVYCGLPEAAQASGQLSEKVHWAVTEDNILYVCGEGEIPDNPDWNGSISDVTELVIAEGITGIGKRAFSSMTALLTVSLPDTLKRIGSGAFYNCDGLKSVFVPASVAVISAPSYNAAPFYGCSGDLVLYCAAMAKPEGWDTHWNCYNGTMTLSASFGSSRSDQVFWSELDTSAQEIVIPEGITTIPAKAFYNCTALESVTIPSSVKVIGSGAFYKCSGLTRLELPEQLTAIGANAFQGCTGLRSVHIPAAVRSIAASSYKESPFYQCSSELVLYCAAAQKQEGWGNYWNYYASGMVLSTNFSFTGADYRFWLSADVGASDFVIPEGVTTIPAKAFYNCTGLRKLTIPGSVVSIGEYAFYNCTGLTELTLPDGIAKIGTGFLSGAAGVTEITLPSALETCGGGSSGTGMLSGSSVTDVTFAEGMLEVPEYALCGAAKVVRVTLPDTVTKIGAYAFYNCTEMTTVNIPSGITELGDYCFSHCRKLSAAQLPQALTSIGNQCFYSCSALSSVTLPAGLKQIGSYAFSGCGITEISVPGGVEQIADYTFNNCTSLRAVTLAEGVTKLGSNAFRNCTALEQITLPETLKTLGYSIFYGCAALTQLRIPGSVEKVNYYYKRGPLDGSGVTKVTFGEGFTGIPAYILSSYAENAASTDASRIKEVVFEDASRITELGEGAFYNCVSLESVTLPDGITVIPDNAFYNCLSLRAVTLPEKLTAFGANAFYSCTALESVSIPGLVKELPDYAFAGCTGLKQVQLSEGLETVGDYAFQNCTALAQIRLPESLRTLGCSVFHGCTGLTQLRIPAGITQARRFGLRGPLDSSGITKVIFGAGTTAIPEYILSSAEGASSSDIREVVFEEENAVTSIGAYAFNNCAALESFTLPSQITQIPNYCFSGCSSLAQVSGLDNVTEIGSYAFYNCSALPEITVPSGQVVGSNAFVNCTGARSLSVGDGAKIGTYAFRNCTGLTEIHIGTDVALGRNAFQGVLLSGMCGESMTYTLDVSTGTLSIEGSGMMDSYSPEDPAPWSGYISVIRNIDFADTVKDIGDYAFAGSTNLDAVILPETMDSVGRSSFADCPCLVYVEIPDGLQFLGENAFGGCNALQEVVFAGDAPVMEQNIFGTSRVQVYYPETASGYTARLIGRYGQYDWTQWDNTVTSKDVVILLDTSGSMEGREETLREATANLIHTIGGALNKTKICLVEYDSTANVLCKFTTNTYRLTRSITALEASGGTEYAAALTKAGELLAGSSADMPFIILFSDGEPNDDKTNIYQLAESLRGEDGITIYTIGLGTNTVQRNVLLKVAGSESKYFEAGSITELQAAFEELSRNFGRSEESTAQMKRGGARWDLFQNTYTLSLASDVSVSLYVTPGIHGKYDGAAAVALEQNGRYVLRNAQGMFENIKPGDWFQSGAPVYAVILGQNDEVIERKELLLNFVDNHTVTYRMGPDMDNRIHREEEFIPGRDLIQPEIPERVGYAFDGWYASESFEGTEFFHELNYHNRIQLEGNITLYAKWKEQEPDLRMGVDNWTFLNSPSSFDGNYLSNGSTVTARYEMSTGDVAALTQFSTFVGKAYLEGRMGRTWSGSAFGMSSAVVLFSSGAMDIYNFPQGGSRYPEVADAILLPNTDPASVGSMESLINFYQLRWLSPEISSAMAPVSETEESSNIRRILEKMTGEDAPVVLGVRLEKGNSRAYHAVVAFDLKETAEGYTFQVYDCSKNVAASYPVTITLEEDVYSAACPEWETQWSGSYDNIFLLNAVTAAELCRLPVLKAPATLSGVCDTAETRAYYTMHTGYGDFTITDGTSSAVIRSGRKTDGTLDIVCHGQVNLAEAEPEYLYELPVLGEGTAYTIVQNGSGAIDTAVYYEHPADGFYLEHSAAAAGTLTISAEGSIGSRYSAPVSQRLQMTHSAMITPWYIVEVSGESAGFGLTPGAEAVTLTSDTQTGVEIGVKSAFNSVQLTEVPAGPVAAEIRAQDDRCVVLRESQIIAGEVYGYSVAFDSRLGTPVPALTNVLPGALIQEPTDPVKAGCIFEGWFIDEALTQPWDFAEDTVTQDMILYALWSLDPNYIQTVTFRIPGNADQILYVTKGERIGEASVPRGPNGEMLSWYQMPNFLSEPWDFASDMVMTDVTLYGKTKLCTVRFATERGEAPEDRLIYEGSLIGTPDLGAVEYYTFCGWYTDEALTVQWHADTDRVAGDMTLYAKWIANETDGEGKDTGICVELLDEEAVIYTGKAVMPAVVVRDGGRILSVNVDYTVKYKNNTAACDKDAESVPEKKRPQILIQGKGSYKSAGTICKYFTIHQADMADMEITLPSSVTVKTGNKLQTLKVTVSTGMVKAGSKDYTVAYYRDEMLSQMADGITEAGIYYVTVEAKKTDGIYTGNYKGVSDAFRTAAVSADKMLSKAKITPPKTVSALSGAVEEDEAIRMLISKLTLNKTVWQTEGEALSRFKELFTVSAVDTDGTTVSQEELGSILTSAGKKTITVTAREENAEGLAGEVSAAVTVKGTPLNKKHFNVTFDRTGKTVNLKTDYTNAAQIPAVFTQLQEGIDFTVTYLNGKTPVQTHQIRNAGTYSLVLTGIGAYSGSLTYKFTIQPVDLAKAYTAGQISILSAGTAVYTASGATVRPTLIFRNSRQLTEGTDYTLAWSNNTKITDTAAVTVKGKGNFKGSLTKAQSQELLFRVEKKPLSSEDIFLTITGITQKNGQVSKISFTVNDGAKKIPAAQYTSSFTDHGETATLTVTAVDKNYTGSRSVEVSKALIKATDKKKVLVSLPEGTKYYYTGSTIHPVIRITDAQGLDISHGFDITYGSNTAVGSGTVVITGRPDMGYYGVNTVKFTILPKWMQWLLGK